MVPAVAILKKLKKSPRDYVADGAWPDGPLEGGAPVEAEVAQHIASVLRDFCQARKLSTYKAAEAAEMSQGALYNLLAGRAWPAVAVVARIERNLGVVLWPQLHNPELEMCPRLYLNDDADNDDWPYGRLKSGAPYEAKMAKKISQEFDSKLGHLDNAASVARRLHVSQGAIEALLHGTAWLDWATIARIERNLKVSLWVHPER